MPTFTAMALDRLLEPGSGHPSSPKPPKPPAAPIKVRRAAQETTTEKSVPWPSISPTLYVIPESTALPDSPSSFPPHSPYLINHKRRGPRLKNSLLQREAAGTEPKSTSTEQNVEVVNGDGHDREEQKAGDGRGNPDGPAVDKFGVKVQDANLNKEMVGTEELAKPQSDDPERVEDTEDFFDPQDSLSTPSNSEVEDNCGRWKPITPITPLGSYYDALDEISSGGTARSSYQKLEDELREMRLNVLMEIEKQKQAEEALENLRNQWKRLSHHLSLVGLKLPVPTIVSEGVEAHANLDPADELYQQVVVARLVTDAMERAFARAEVELEMEPQIASKDFEIARLWDRLHYYEAVNREMSQRNQEAVEMARQQRNRRKMRQKWIWSSICLAISLGGAAIAWSYLPSSNPIPSEVDPTSSHEQ